MLKMFLYSRALTRHVKEEVLHIAFSMCGVGVKIEAGSNRRAVKKEVPIFFDLMRIGVGA